MMCKVGCKVGDLARPPCDGNSAVWYYTVAGQQRVHNSSYVHTGLVWGIKTAMPIALFYFGRTTIWMPVHHELRATTPSPHPNQARPALLLDSFPSTFSIEIRRTAVRQQRGRRRSAVPEGDFEAPSARRFTDPPASPPTTPSPTAAPDDECEDGKVVRGLWDAVWQWQATPTTCIRNVHSRATPAPSM